MIGDDVRARIRRLFFAEHWKIGTIAVELDVHRAAVEAHWYSRSAFGRAE